MAAKVRAVGDTDAAIVIGVAVITILLMLVGQGISM